jgi:hypothetical protein
MGQKDLMIEEAKLKQMLFELTMLEVWLDGFSAAAKYAGVKCPDHGVVTETIELLKRGLS